MKVLYDHQIFNFARIGGIARYFTELLRYNHMAELSLKYSDTIYLQDQCFSNYKILPMDHVRNTFLPGFNFKGKGFLRRSYSKVFKKNNLAISIDSLKRNKFDVFHPTYYEPYFLKYLKRKPFVLTVYDMIHELFPHFFLNDKDTIPYKQLLIPQADVIIAISENTKKDILKFFPTLSEKIKVIYLASSFQQINERIKKEKYILFTGARALYKNFTAFAEAIAPLLIKYNFNLVCTGHPFSPEERLLLKNLTISDRSFCKYVSDDELVELYSKSTIFVFPSIYEGFGIPVLEAFSSNCPAILSNTSSLPEIGGDAAVYFDPYSIESMRQQIERVLISPSLQEEMIQKGKERLKLFSWEKCAEETMEVYKELV